MTSKPIIINRFQNDLKVSCKQVKCQKDCLIFLNLFKNGISVSLSAKNFALVALISNKTPFISRNKK